MTRETMSLRLDSGLRQRLVQAAQAERVTVTALAERYLREGLAAAAHPGIVFRPGPAGRRAGLAGGPDVWEVTSALRRISGTQRQRIATLAQEFGLHPRQIAIALDYAAAHRAEIEAWIKANDDALDAVEALAAERDRLFA